MQILERLEKLNIEKIDQERLKNFFSNLTSEEIEVILDLVKNLDFYKIRIENLDIDDEELKKNLIVNLAFRNEAKSISKELIEVERNLLKTINTLPSEIKRKISIAYILKGLHILNLNKNQEIFKYKKIILKYFHDLGGFKTGLWGIKIDYDLFENIIENINEDLIRKLEAKNRVLNKEEFIMLRNLF